MSDRCHPPGRGDAGFSLLEAVLSLVILSIVMVSVGSAMVFAGAATPDEDSPVAVAIRDHAMLARIAEDFSLATYVTEQTSTSITVIVPDRTGDHVPDRLRYAWGGVAGDPLTFSMNGSTPVEVLAGVQTFGLTYDTRTHLSTLPGPRSYGSEQLISSYTTTLLSSNVTTSNTAWNGQFISPSLSAEAIGIIPTRVDLYTSSSDEIDGTVEVRLESATSGLPDGITTYNVEPLDEDQLDDGGWTTITFSDSALVPRGQDIALYAKPVTGANSFQLATNTLLGSGYLKTTNSGTSWSYLLLRSLLHRLYGKEVFQSPPIDVSRSRCHRVTVSLNSNSSATGIYSRTVRFHHVPELSDYFWHADFSADPTQMDLDADGQDDWIGNSDDFEDTELADGVWSVGRPVSTSPTQLLNGVVTVEARLRSTTGDGVGLYGPYSGSDSSLLSLVTQLSQDGSGGQKLSFHQSADLSSPIAWVSDLPQGWIDLRLVVITDENIVAVQVNGEMAGALSLSRISDSTTARNFSARPIGTDGEVDYLRVKVGGGYAVQQSTSDDGLISSTLNLVGF